MYGDTENGIHKGQPNCCCPVTVHSSYHERLCLYYLAKVWLTWVHEFVGGATRCPARTRNSNSKRNTFCAYKVWMYVPARKFEHSDGGGVCSLTHMTRSSLVWTRDYVCAPVRFYDRSQDTHGWRTHSQRKKRVQNLRCTTCARASSS